MGLAMTEDAGARLAAHLRDSGLLPPAALARAEEARRGTGETLAGALLALGLMPEEALAAALSRALGLDLLRRDDLPADPPLLDRLAPRFLHRARAWPVRLEGERLVLALADPLDGFAAQAAALATGRPVTVAVAEPSAIAAAQARHAAQREAAPAAEGGSGAEDATRLRDRASEAPVIRYVDDLILRAVESGASDIHLEAAETGLRLRFRVDGVLRDAGAVPPDLGTGAVSRLKIMARLDVAERRLPQDGRLRLAVRGRDIDLRVSVIPALDGEGIVLRILDRSAVALDLGALGYAEEEVAALRAMLAETSRLVLVTGPTGSGKTTTLYAALHAVDRGRLKVVTIEDPVEYRLDGVMQVQVRQQIGFGFAEALRAMLRHDPDVVLVGEIRDAATAEAAAQAALTGHLVLATLHTNDAPSAVTRLMDLGLPDYLIASVLRGVVAQRLVRTLCRACRDPFAAPRDMLARYGLGHLARGDREVVLHRARGCAACVGTGYSGRTAILQVMPVTPPLRDAVLRRADAGTLHALAEAEGMPGLGDAARRKVLAGVTSMEEVMRVVGH